MNPEIAVASVYLLGFLASLVYVVVNYETWTPRNVAGDLGRAFAVMTWPLIFVFILWKLLCQDRKH